MLTYITRKDNGYVYRIRTEPNWVTVQPYRLYSLCYDGFKTTVNEELVQTYDTEEAAIAGHEKWVKEYMKRAEEEKRDEEIE